VQSQAGSVIYSPYQRRWQDNEQQHHTLCLVSHGLQGAHDGARLSRGGITALNEQGYDERHIELQLALLAGNATQRAYGHSKYMPERTKMMQDWADFLDAQRGKGKVIKMHG
jgi:hypothetical protein